MKKLLIALFVLGSVTSYANELKVELSQGAGTYYLQSGGANVGSDLTDVIDVAVFKAGFVINKNSSTKLEITEDLENYRFDDPRKPPFVLTYCSGVKITYTLRLFKGESLVATSRFKKGGTGGCAEEANYEYRGYRKAHRKLSKEIGKLLKEF